MKPLLKTWVPALTVLGLVSSMAVAQTPAQTPSQERESLESLRQTTRKLIDALVQSGAISPDKAQALLQQAQQDSGAASHDTPASASASAVAATDAGTAPAVPSGKPVQRVPYISDVVRAQIRNELREEITAVARNERWGAAGAAPSWTDRLKLDGDLRIRHQSDRPGKKNTPASDYLASEIQDDGTTRAPEFSAASSSGQSSASTTQGRDRTRVRMRLGVTAKVTDEVSVGVRLATGSATDRVSTNQTLGQNFNKYQLFVDRAYVKVDPAEWLTIQAGRIPNPWFSTEMVWSDNLNFEGAAATARWIRPDAALTPFVTVGAFPVREANQLTGADRWLYGAQLGFNWLVSERTRLRAGLAYYQYQGIEGRADKDYTTDVSTNKLLAGPSYGQYEYPVGLRQKGNTLFETNPAGADISPVWGLAYGFKPVALTVAADLDHFSPYYLTLSGEYVQNTGFDVADFKQRSGLSLDPGGRDEGFQLKMTLGARDVQDFGQWQLAASYRHVGSDAVLDAFTDSDLGLGGTNLEGYSLALTYGLYRNTSLSLRYLTAKTIDSPVSSLYVNEGNGEGEYKVNSLQVDLNVRF